MRKKQILFVDDEPFILNGLRRMLHRYEKEWDMYFSVGGREALQNLAEKSIDIIVSDVKMPVMDGIELLTKVKERYPNIIRIVLSGHASEEQTEKVVSLAHQFLSKPCKSTKIKSVIDEAYYLQGILKNENARRILANIEFLPAIPTVYQELMNEAHSDNFSLKNVSKIIATDVNMSANILKLVNSSYWGLPHNVSSLEQATNLLGFDVIRGVLLSSHLFHSMPLDVMEDFSPNDLMDHAITCSQLAQMIVTIEGGDKTMRDRASVAGMLHDIGKFILLSNFSTSYKQVITLVQESNSSYNDIEKDVLGITHSEIGAYLLGLWGLERDIVEAIAFHHTPSLSAQRTLKPLLAVAAADHISYYGDRKELPPSLLTYGMECGISKEQMESWQHLGVNFLKEYSDE